MENFEKKFLDIVSILERDKLITYLLNYDLTYCLNDIIQIKKLQKKLLFYLEKGKNYD